VSKITLDNSRQTGIAAALQEIGIPLELKRDSSFIRQAELLETFGIGAVRSSEWALS
jgi:hypothetical protein